MWRDPIARARTKLAIQFALLCGALLIGSGSAVYLYVRNALHASFDAAHDLAVRSVLETVERGPTGLRVKDSEFAEEFDELKSTLGVMAVGIWSADGTKLAEASVHPWSVSPAGPDRELRDSEGGPVVVRRDRIAADRGGGVMLVTRSAADLERSLGTFRRGLLLFVPLSLLASLLAGWAMAGRSLKPVRRVIEQQRIFMADASHEIRTPLAIIRTHAEIAMDGPADTTSMKRSLEVVAATGAQLGRLVDDLMYLARSDASVLERRHSVVDVEDLLEEAIEGFGPMAASKKSRLLLKDIETVHVQGDPSQLKRLVAILIDNALRHADPGEIRVSLAMKTKEVELLVEDTGPGISDELLPRVFERFVHGDSARQPNGSGHGLGLAIARSIVASHGGQLALRRNTSGGTTASVMLPAANA